MHQALARLALGGALLIGFAAPALAQDAPAEASAAQAAPAAARAPAAKLIFRAYGDFDRMAMSASQSFDAVFSSSSLTGFGAGGEALDLWKGLFARATFGMRGADGHRVIVSEGQVIGLGIPIELSMKDFTFGGGWRQTVHPRLIAYGGAGFVSVSYRETSDFGVDDKTSFTGQTVFGGAEFPLTKWLFAGAEVEWRTVPDALGEFTSASRAFQETNLGGTAVRILFGIRK